MTAHFLRHHLLIISSSSSLSLQALQAGQKQNPGRQASMNAGIPQEVPAFALNMLCGSGVRDQILFLNSILIIYFSNYFIY